jgi:hypothetical protein
MLAVVVFLLLPAAVQGVHDSLNVILPPGGQECFFEEFAQDSAEREIDIFVPQNGNVDIILKVMCCSLTVSLIHSHCITCMCFNSSHSFRCVIHLYHSLTISLTTSLTYSTHACMHVCTHTHTYTHNIFISPSSDVCGQLYVPNQLRVSTLLLMSADIRTPNDHASTARSIL